MILVTLGTHPKPMDRLIVALDDLIDRGRVREEVIVTAAAYGRRPMRATGLGIQPYDVLMEMVHRANAVITHGGPASIALALAAGHSPVVVPRDPALREHVDDHQLRFASWLAEQRKIKVVRSMDELDGALEEARSARADSPRDPPVPAEAIARLRSILAGGR